MPTPRRKPHRPGFVPLERALSKLGLASRTQAKRWIEEGRVRVDGILRKNAGFSVFPERAKIEIDGLEAQASGSRTYLLYKPRGTVTTHSDEKGRPTVFSLISGLKGHWIAVGRLDWATSGLLLVTTDSRLASWLTDPLNGVQRTYLVSVRGEMSEEKLKRMIEGVEEGGDLLHAEEVILRKASQKESHLTIYLHEGKNREIRRMLSALGHEVTRLKRVAYGKLELGSLEPGEYRELSAKQLKAAFPGIQMKEDGKKPDPR